MNPAGLSCLFCLFLFISCNSSEEKKASDSNKDTTTTLKKETKVQAKTEVKSKKPPIINIVDTIASKRIIVYFRDSTANFERINIKLAKIYGVKLAEVFKKNALKAAGQPMAWFISRKAPYFFEAGMPVNKKPLKLTAGANVRELGADSAVIAHFYGPYDLTNAGYDALIDWMKEHNKKASGSPYEIYITDPFDKKGKPVDPYKVQTDIVFPRK